MNYQLDHIYSVNTLFVKIEPAQQRYKTAEDIKKALGLGYQKVDVDVWDAKAHIEAIGNVKDASAVKCYTDAVDAKEALVNSYMSAFEEFAEARTHLGQLYNRLENKMYEMWVCDIQDACETPDDYGIQDQTCEPRIINKYKATRGYTRHQIKAPIVSKHAVQNAWKEKHKIARQRQSRSDNYEP